MKETIEIGDRVAVLDDSIEGVVINISTDEVEIETTDGFSMSFPMDQLINMSSAEAIEERDLFLNYKSKVQDETKKKSKPKRSAVVIEIDLHIHKLLPSTKGMTKHDILTFQLETARKQLEFAISNQIPKLILIHGVGDGILKSEINFLLGRYQHIEYYDAPYVKYGFGATEVAISPNAKRA